VYRKQVRRRRAVLVLLVVVCLVLISTHFSEGDSGPLHSVEDGVSTILNPIEEGASRALKPARDLVNWFDETFDARGENEDLRNQVDELRGELVTTQQAIAKARLEQQVSKLMDEGGLSGYEPVDAAVTARSSSVWFSSLKIDQGSSVGISKNDAVVTGQGLVGRVASVTGGSARVVLITDPKSGVTARGLKKGPTGTIEPAVGDPGGLIFNLIQSDEEPDGGTTLVTAGFDDGTLNARLPAGIPVGEVSETSAVESAKQATIHVDPFADLVDLPEVTVLTGGQS
jgi:rod shape-determining protein MreC